MRASIAMRRTPEDRLQLARIRRATETPFNIVLEVRP
jgi:hypothetical protein